MTLPRTSYSYRVVLQQPNGEELPLLSQGADLEGCQERLRDILADPDTTYPTGWIERQEDQEEAPWERLGLHPGHHEEIKDEARRVQAARKAAKTAPRRFYD